MVQVSPMNLLSCRTFMSPKHGSDLGVPRALQHRDSPVPAHPHSIVRYPAQSLCELTAPQPLLDLSCTPVRNKALVTFCKIVSTVARHLEGVCAPVEIVLIRHGRSGKLLFKIESNPIEFAPIFAHDHRFRASAEVRTVIGSSASG